MPLIYKDKVTHVGCVLDEYEHNKYDDSDFYAIVWDEETQSVQQIQYASTSYYSYDHGCVIDATPEVLAKADAWGRARSLKQRLHVHNYKAEKEFAQGRKVRVVKGRKIAKGTEGEIISVHERNYGPSYNNVGVVRSAYVDTGRDRVYINIDNLVLIDIDEHKAKASQITEVIDNRNWRSRYLYP